MIGLRFNKDMVCVFQVWNRDFLLFCHIFVETNWSLEYSSDIQLSGRRILQAYLILIIFGTLSHYLRQSEMWLFSCIHLNRYIKSINTFIEYFLNRKNMLFRLRNPTKWLDFHWNIIISKLLTQERYSKSFKLVCG